MLSFKNPRPVRRSGYAGAGLRRFMLTEDMRIFIDHVRVTSLQLLASLPATDISHIQVLTGPQATTRYGTNSGDGVILIRTRKGAPPDRRGRPQTASAKVQN